MKASSIQSVVIVLLLCVSLGVMGTGAGTAKTRPGGKPTGPGGKPTGPGGKPTGPGSKPTSPGGKPTGPGGKPPGPGGKPPGPGGKPTGPGSKPTSPGGKPPGPGGKPPGAGGKPPGPGGKPDHVTCYNHGSKCFMKHVTCPVECPKVKPKDGKSKRCFLDCNSPKCEAVCTGKPDCNGVGAVCFDPRFIGGDGIAFYFHGKSNEHFSLVSDINLQINSRFIGLRPAGRTRDYTWIQALGLMFGSHTFTLDATRTEKWDGEEDHLQFSYDGEALSIPEGLYSKWTSPENNLKVERISSKNSVTVTLSGAVEISVNVIPVTEEDNRIHNYQIPSNDSFAHLEVQFWFFSLSAKVEGVLGQTYQPNFHNTAKAGVAMPIVGGADKYRTSSLISADCKSCLFSPTNNVTGDQSLPSMEYAQLDCTSGVGSGNGIVCRK